VRGRALNLDVVIDEKLVERAAGIERWMKAAFQETAQKFEIIGDVRERGVLLSVELVTDPVQKTAANREAEAIARHCLHNGLILQVRGSHGRRNVLRFVAPMVTTDAEVECGLSIVDDAFGAVCG
jgi:4-aminobutyrate aminotransferase/(S)-3-amino-2-methylpropionate transaminase